MRLAFMGTPDFAVPALTALNAAGHDIAAVYSQPPRPAGRGQTLRPSPVQREAERLGLPVRTPARLKRDEAEHAAFAALDLDAAVVAAYGLILPPAMLAAPRRGCLNIHASLLPRWRGAAPIQAAILAGDAETGVTIMRMDEGLDTGPILLSAAIPLDAASTAAGLHDRLAALGAELLLQALATAPRPTPQPDGATYAPKLTAADGALDWTASADTLDRRIRALNPWPGTYTTLAGTRLKVLAARRLPSPASLQGRLPGRLPGETIDASLTVACGVGALTLLRVQAPGRAAMPAADFLRGRRLPPGTVLGAPPPALDPAPGARP